MADAAELRTRFDALARAYPSGQHGRWAAGQRSNALDAWFAEAFDDVGGRVALLALGGYGRGLQLPGSDIDVLLVHDDVDAAVLAELGEQLWYPLWDQGWTVTPLVRTPAECVEAARERLDSCTAMLDARVIAGAGAIRRRGDRARRSRGGRSIRRRSRTGSNETAFGARRQPARARRTSRPT